MILWYMFNRPADILYKTPYNNSLRWQDLLNSYGCSYENFKARRCKIYKNLVDWLYLTLAWELGFVWKKNFLQKLQLTPINQPRTFPLFYTEFSNHNLSQLVKGELWLVIIQTNKQKFLLNTYVNVS